MAILQPKTKFIFGIVLIFCGWVICFDLFMLVFGIPFFLLGAILILFCKKSWVVKALIIGVPIILWFAVFKFVLYQISKTDAVTVVVTNKFSGPVRVVYGEKNGIVPETKEGRLILNVPENGILIVQPYIKSGLTDIEYYYVNDKGVKIKMPAMKSPNDKVARPAGYFEGTMSSETSASGESLDYIYDAFYILGNDSAKVLTYQEEMVKNPLTDSLVKVTRGIK